jgi:hypothetical protein
VGLECCDGGLGDPHASSNGPLGDAFGLAHLNKLSHEVLMPAHQPGGETFMKRICFP